MDANSTFSLFGDNAATMLSVLVFLAAGTLAFAVMIGVRAREAVRRRAARVGLDDDAAGRPALAALFGARRPRRSWSTIRPSITPSADSNDVKMLRRRLMQAGIYDPHGAGLFLPRPRGAWRSVSPSRAFFVPADVRARRQILVLAVRHVRRRAGLSGAEPSISTAGSRRRRAGAPGRLSRFHGSSGGLRRCRAEHGGGARPRRPRARRFLSVARRQYPHGQSRNPRRPHHDARRSNISATGSASKRRAPSPR